MRMSGQAPMTKRDIAFFRHFTNYTTEIYKQIAQMQTVRAHLNNQETMMRMNQMHLFESSGEYDPNPTGMVREILIHTSEMIDRWIDFFLDYHHPNVASKICDDRIKHTIRDVLNLANDLCGVAVQIECLGDRCATVFLNHQLRKVIVEHGIEGIPEWLENVSAANLMSRSSVFELIEKILDEDWVQETLV